MRSSYNTRQRDEIVLAIKAMEERHFTVSDIIVYLTEKGTPIGNATVYRTIEMLEKNGTLRKYIIDESSSACYQYVGDTALKSGCAEHFHLKCLECKRLFHVDCDHIKELSEHMKNDHGFTVDMSKTVLYGICKECRAKDMQK